MNRVLEVNKKKRHILLVTFRVFLICFETTIANKHLYTNTVSEIIKLCKQL